MVLEIEGRPVRGEFLRIGTTVNSMVDQLNSFAAEVTRVAKEVGNEGKLGGQADVKGVCGTWKDLTDNVNGLAANLTAQVRNIAKVTTAVAKGDLSQKITVDAKGEILELKNTINAMVDQLSSFAAEVTRVAKEVGNEGKLGGQAEVRGVSRHVEGPDRQRQRPRRQPHRPGAQHREGHHRRRERRPVAEDHRRRARRDLRAEEHHQHDGRHAPLVRRRSDPRREGSRHRRQARRPGRRQGRLRHVEGPDRQRQRAWPRTSPSSCATSSKVATAIANGDLSQKITVDVEGRDPPDQGRHQQDGRSAQLASPPRSRASRRKSAPKESSAARPT